jgi:hypothetical protein
MDNLYASFADVGDALYALKDCAGVDHVAAPSMSVIVSTRDAVHTIERTLQDAGFECESFGPWEGEDGASDFTYLSKWNRDGGEVWVWGRGL